MKYAYYILKHIIPEWVFMYLNYGSLKQFLSIPGGLKDFLLLAKKTRPLQEYQMIKRQILTMTYLMNKIDADNQEFSERFGKEVDKVRKFVKAKHDDLKQKLVKLQRQVHAMKVEQSELEERLQKFKSLKKFNSGQVVDYLTIETNIALEKVDEVREVFMAKKSILKDSLYKLYIECLHFDKFLLVNQEAIRKILKKYNKKMLKVIRNRASGNKFKVLVDDLKIGVVQTKVKQILFAVEKNLINNYYRKNPTECKNNLRKYQQKNENKAMTQFIFGLFSGLCIMLIILLISIALEGQISEDTLVFDELVYTFFPVCRGILLFLIYYWSLAANVWFWNKNKINYKQYFQFNHHFSTLNQLLKRVMILSSIMLSILVIYIGQLANLGEFLQDIQLFNSNYLPVVLWLVFLIFLFMPTRIYMNGQGRSWLFKSIMTGLMLTSKQITDQNIFISEQFTTLIVPLIDMNYTICEYYHAIVKGIIDSEIECFDNTKYIILSISVLPYFMLFIQQWVMMRKGLHKLRIMKQVSYVINIIVIFFSIFENNDNDLWIAWLVFASLSFIMQLVIWIVQFYYITQTESFDQLNNKGYLKYLNHHSKGLFYQLLALNVILLVNQTLSISTNVFYSHLPHSDGYVILIVGILEIIRRMIKNHLIVEKAHRINQKQYNTVGKYEYPFDQLCDHLQCDQTLSNELSLFNDSTDNNNQNITQSASQNNDLQGLPDSVQTFAITKKLMSLTEIISKDSEKHISDSIYQCDESEDMMMTLEQIIRDQDNQDSLVHDRISQNNKFYRAELDFLYKKFKIQQE